MTNNIIPLNQDQLTATVDHVTATVWPAEHLGAGRYTVRITRHYIDDDGQPVKKTTNLLDHELAAMQAILGLISAKLRDQQLQP